MLDEGYEVSFDIGKFDTETFNMQITNFEVFKNDKRYWNADAILLDTILLPDGRTLIVKNLKTDSFVSSVNKLKLGSIIFRNVTLDKYDHLLAGEIGSLVDHAINNAYLGMFDFEAPINGSAEYFTLFQSIELTPVRRTTMPSGSSYLNRIGMRGVTTITHHLLYHQNKVQQSDKIAADELVGQLSLQNFDVAFDIENVLIEDSGVMRSELSGHIDIKNHFSVDIEFDAEVSLPAFWVVLHNKDLNTIFTREFGDTFTRSFFQSDAALSRLSLGIRDYGTFDRLLNLHAEQSGQSVSAATEDI